jgi:dCMP deaminase
MKPNIFMRIAKTIASASYCKRAQVGAILVKDGNIIAIGYNGTPKGWENICEDDSGKTKEYVMHAESNAIAKCAASGQSSHGATLYVTHSPCAQCAKLIIQCGIEKVYYGIAYRDFAGLSILDAHGIECEQLVDWELIGGQ